MQIFGLQIVMINLWQWIYTTNIYVIMILICTVLNDFIIRSSSGILLVFTTKNLFCVCFFIDVRPFSVEYELCMC